MAIIILSLSISIVITPVTSIVTTTSINLVTLIADVIIANRDGLYLI